MTLDPALFFRILSDETRLRCLLLLQRERELCVCELTHALGASQPKVSRHLATIRDAGVVLDRRRGQWIYYRLNPDLPPWAAHALEATAAGVTGQFPFCEDRERLAEMSNRPGALGCV